MFEDDNNEVETSEETQEDVELESYEEDTTEEVEEEKDWKAEAEAERARRIKAEEAIEKAKQKQKKAPTVSTNGLSTADIIALTRANINDEDIDEVLEYASLKKIPVSQALKSDVIQATLNIREEKRKSASAVHSGNTRRATSGSSDDRLLDNAKRGILPDSDADIQRLVELRLKNKKR